MDGECRFVHRQNAFDHVAAVIHAEQVGHLDMAEMHAERIDPESVGELGITRRDVTGHALVKTKARKQPELRGQHLFAVQAFFLHIGEFFRLRQRG